MFQNILVLCTGNICRSPMAEALLRAYLREQGHNIKVSSAGIGALVGHSADPTAIKLMQEKNIDISDHIARQISEEILKEAELILVMERYQQEYLENQMPSITGKVHRLGKWEGIEIPDPYRQGEETFRHSLFLIEQSLQSWIKKLC